MHTLQWPGVRGSYKAWQDELDACKAERDEMKQLTFLSRSSSEDRDRED